MIFNVVIEPQVNNELAINVVIGIGITLLVLLILFLILYPIFKRKYMYRNFKVVYYKKIKSIAEKNDYLLLNNLIIKDKDISLCQIDHILFAKKYIYVIKDRFYRGAISGQKGDNIWLFFSNKDEKTEIHNPLLVNKKRIETLANKTGISMDFFVSIVVVNNDCVLKNPKELNSKRNFIVASKNLDKLIKDIEKRDIKELDQEMLDLCVKDIYRLYGAGRIEEEEVAEEDEL